MQQPTLFQVIFAAFWIYCCFVELCLSKRGRGKGKGKGKGENSYDYIIVGAGTGGSVVAGQLAELDQDADILLIEEGNYNKLNPKTLNIIDAVEFFFFTSQQFSIDRQYYTVPQPDLSYREIFLPRAKMTGGCNSLNANIWVFANENDFSERWGNIDGWTLDDLLPIWDKVQEKSYHGYITDMDHPYLQRLLQAGLNLGYEFNPDWNDLKDGKSQDGITPVQLQSKKINDTYYERRSAWTDFVEPILRDKENYNNIDVLVNTRVNKILLNKKNDKAVGVETENLGNFDVINYHAKKEIIIAGGVYDTPKLLLLSGIGDCDELEGLDIECKVNLPGVGKNLQDHFIFNVVGPPIIDTQLADLLASLPDEFFSVPSWTVPTVIDKGKFFIQPALVPADLSTIPTRDTLEYVSFAMFCIYNQPTSIGSVTLADNNPNTRPVIDHKYLSTDEDKLNMVEAINIARSFLYDSGAFDDFINAKEQEIFPGDIYQSNEALLWFLSNFGNGFLHPAGSCKMGNSNDNDEMSVVNERLQVKNIKNLRIADASIMPKVVSANTNQMTMVIGYKAALMIHEDNQ